MQRKSVVGTRSSLLWLLILAAVLLLAALAVVALVVAPQLQASRTEQARLAEVERHYQAGVAFQNMEDWAGAEGEYQQIITLDASYKDTPDRLTTVKARKREIAATATAEAVALAGRVQAEASATAQVAPAATQQALETHYQKGLGYLNMKRWAEAKMELEQIFGIDPNYKDVQARLPEIMAQLATPTDVPMPVSTSAPQPTPTPKQDVHRTLSANDSAGLRINVSVGDRLTVIATGKVHTSPGGTVADCDYWTDPNGIASCHYVSEVPELHGLPFMALVAQVNGDWVLIGERTSITITRGPNVWFMINDWGFTDSQGSFALEIRVE